VAFELEASESAGAGVRRIVDEQLASALEELRAADAKTADAAVHSARKRFKRIRAVVRLAREALGEATFASENASFRDAGGSLSEARDAAVLVKTLESLKADVDPAVYTVERRKLLARRRAVTQRVLELGDGFEAVAKAADAARERVGRWAFADEGWDAIAAGLKRVYRDGRVAFTRAEIGGHAELFHEWRKRVKDLWHQTEVLEDFWPPMMTVLAEEFHALADLLGDEHDLSVLTALLEAEALTKAQPVSGVVVVARAKQLELQHAARALGARLFAEKPGAFVKRFGRYWRAWKDSAATEAKVEAEVAPPPVAEEPTPAATADADQGQPDVHSGTETGGAAA
jgi:CHAD domain-containing protein